ncbi:S8/S53 family peptidase [Dactylosporangium sp. NBC_01737]|uniref:S8 family peptidase n=1 Tax=Dactylosporangium sp. NBC_01737 TaxID=2975959 RepID=UPI002E0EC291|nr:S8/S53 family peptidase [Dactylosporangium sp. NBC_01737]
MAPADARSEQWRSRRARRLAGLGWVRREDRADGTPVRFVADELLVLDDHFATARQAFVEQGFIVGDIVEEGDVPDGFRRVRLPGLDVARAARRVRVQAEAAGDTRVAAGPNHVFVSTPFEHAGPYGPPRPTAPGHLTVRDHEVPEVEVLVLDTGVWLNSPLPKDRYVTDDFESDLSDGTDAGGDGVRDGDVGHANFVAGVLLTRSERVRPRVMKIVDTFGVCRESDLIAGLGQAYDHQIINLSLGGYTLDDRPPLLLTAALARLLGSGDRVVVAAAGNDGQHDRPFWPAAYAGTSVSWRRRVIAVAAHDGRRISDWSNTGTWITLAAPGADVTSTFVNHEGFDDGWATWSGTSFAAPFVAAAIADALPGAGSARLAAEAVIAGAARRYGRYAGLA